ncbi:MAG: hypothetical protein RSD32_04615 [Oscillospiraceae bacterium]
MRKFADNKAVHISHVTVIIATVLLLCGLSVGAYAFMAPASYVSMDVNPSIEYTLNMFDRVLSVNAVNEDGAQILKDIDLKDMNNAAIDEAIAMTLAEITKEGYFDGNAPGGVVITTSGKETEASATLAGHLKELVEAECAKNKQNVSIEAMSIDKAKLEEAKALGVTPGKLLLVQKLQAENPGGEAIALEDWLKKSVREIMAETERLDELNDKDEDDKDTEADKAEDLADEAEDKAEEETDKAEEAAEAEREAAEEAKDKAEEKADKEKEAAEKKKDEAAEAADKAKDEADKLKDKAEKEKEAAEDKAKEAADKAEEEAELAKEAEEAKAEEAKEAEEAEEPTEPEEAEE